MKKEASDPKLEKARVEEEKAVERKAAEAVEETPAEAEQKT